MSPREPLSPMLAGGLPHADVARTALTHAIAGRCSPTDAARHLVATLQTIDREARRAARTVPTQAERDATLVAFWGIIEALASLEHTAGPVELADAGSAVRALIGPWLMRSRYWNRSAVKPHGYAGEFRMLELMYDLEDCPCADTTQPAIVNALDSVYASVHSVQAVWHRRQWFADLVRRESAGTDRVAVLDVACGGSRYLRDLMTETEGARITGVFVDQDPAAIAFVNRWLPDSGSQAVCAPARNLRRAVTRDGFDVVIATGLFDYLPRAPAQALLGDMVALTRPGGVTAICNFSPDDGSRLVKDHVSEWQLIYRAEGHVAGLFPQPASVAVDRSPDRGLIYASARTPAECATCRDSSDA